MPSKMWDEITCPFLNFNGCTVDVLEWIIQFIPHFAGHVLTLSMMGFKLNHVDTPCWTPYKIGTKVTVSWNYIHCIVWDEITYPFQNFNGYTVEVWEWISNFIPHFIGRVITYPGWD